MEKIKQENKKIIIVLILLLILLIGGSYALLRVSVTGQKSNVLIAGGLSLELDDSTASGINIEKTVPMSDEKGLETEEYTFMLKNNGTVDSDYTIYLDDETLDENETRMLDKYVKYSLVKNEGTVTQILTSTGTNPNRVIDTGIIEKNKTNTYSLKVWIDSNADNEVMNTVFKAKLRVEASQYIEKGPLCKRAVSLHNEICEQRKSEVCCSGVGYGFDPPITYGNLGTRGTLNSGDAFDCDINGDQIYDATTERFYYVSGVNGEENSDDIVLIYYNNVSKGIANNKQAAAYNAINNDNSEGPKSAILELPTIDQWTNVSLINNTRSIKDEQGNIKVENFDYTGYAARLLTVQEINKSCNINVGNSIRGEMDNCEYLNENTIFSNPEFTYGYWLENATSSNLVNAWNVYSYDRSIYNFRAYSTTDFGVRPAIEISKSNIEY